MARTRADLIADRFGVLTQHNLSDPAATVGLADMILRPLNPNRLALVVVNLGGGALYLAPGRAAAVGSAIVVAAGGGLFSMEWQDDYDLVGLEWHALADLAATPVLWAEVVAR